jgi:pimeloyl-ACP methyl ester carboxylesterase
MSYAKADDGVALHVEQTGSGAPVLFIHEFAGDLRSWEPQVRAFSRRYTCIRFNARGYPPSDVPTDPGAYSQDRAVADAVAVLEHAEVTTPAHIVGLSMGGFCALHLGLRHPNRVRSLVVAGVGYGAHPDAEGPFRRESEVIATSFERDGAAVVADRYAQGPARVQFQTKDPTGWAEFARRLAEHSAVGSALTMRGVQGGRPSLYTMRDELAALTAPVLVITGDEDEGCLDASLMLKRTLPAAGLAMVPKTGHTVNLEEPTTFNSLLADFFGAVENGAWHERDHRSVRRSLTGMTG